MVEDSHNTFRSALYFIFVGTIIFILGVLYAKVYNYFIDYWTFKDKCKRAESFDLFSNSLLFTVMLTIFFILVIYLLNGTDRIAIVIDS